MEYTTDITYKHTSNIREWAKQTPPFPPQPHPFTPETASPFTIEIPSYHTGIRLFKRYIEDRKVKEAAMKEYLSREKRLVV
ncbi:hypothetical protein HYALB_00006598 [Hymenoscyphus albidus]|uniref:Uncharacterized protein n=1 Tax=Hymenoscyphus albidus TaxID=595503 RepID=A0A9N9LNR2_9HELO|nr:hypothetical protein HYALB_00006598 [Hymenoscyphus albidus]